jgi:hypothetical protein
MADALPGMINISLLLATPLFQRCCEDEGITYQVSYQICKEVTKKDGIGRNQDDEQSVECL